MITAFKMENVENGLALTQITRTDLSDWSGAPVSQPAEELDAVKIEDRVAPDELDFGLRGYDLLSEGYGIELLNYGPGGSPPSFYHLMNLFKNSPTFTQLLTNYEGFSYDQVEFRVTMSNPKGIAGGVIVAVFPYSIWITGNFQDQRNAWILNNMTLQHVCLAPQAELLGFGEAHDIVFTVPWQYNVPYITTRYVTDYSDTSTTNQLWPGTPVIAIRDVGITYVSGQSLPAQIRIFVKFHGLKWYAPRFLSQSGGEDPRYDQYFNELYDNPYSDYLYDLSGFELQSGMPPVDATLVGLGMAADAIGSEIMTAFTDAVKPSQTDESNLATYENPQAVQMAYVGDAAKVGPPSTTPFFRPWQRETEKHPISHYLTQPQYLETEYTNDTGAHILYANPTAPRGAGDLSGNDQCCTYFRYWSQAASFWRGTIIFDFVFLGHPMVEVAYSFKISYPPWSYNTTNTYSRNSYLKGVCSGVYRISIPMPFMVQVDHLPIHDTIGVLADVRNSSSSMLTSYFATVSTALSVAPNIPIAIFMRAGDDFQFLQPYAIGLGYVDKVQPTLMSLNESSFEVIREGKKKYKRYEAEPSSLFGFEAQCGLPKVADVFQTRAMSQMDTSQMKSLVNVEDLMQIWSRALPFAEWNQDHEPTVTLEPGIQPYWFPMDQTQDATTLGSKNSWWVTNDYVSLYSSMFLYYRGSIGFKILCKPDDTGYKYVSQTMGDGLRRKGHNPFTYNDAQLPPQANFGYGTVATDAGSQPVLEFTIPLRSSLQWAFTNSEQMRHVANGFYYGTYLSGSCHTNVILHVPNGDLEAALYRKIGKDFSLAVQALLPPPTLWMAKGFDWS